MTVETLEKLAINSADMPDDLNTAEQLLYQKLRYLYASFKTGIITQEQGKREKVAILRVFRKDSFEIKLLGQHVKIYNNTQSLLSAANKSDCELCKTFSRLLTGMEKPKGDVEHESR